MKKLTYLTDAYLQFEVDDETKRFLTVNTHKGLYRYNRLPYGVKATPAIFQKCIDQILSGIDGVTAYLDDILIHAHDIDTLEQNIFNVLNRLQEFNLTAKWEKCEFFCNKTSYLGFVIDANGIHSDTSKVKSILDMPPPKNVTQLRSFLGAINYYGKFLPKMHDLRAPLNKLLLKETHFEWTDECQSCFVNFKKMLTQDLFVSHFDPNQIIKVSADASNNGIGACISHVYSDGTEKSIAYASRTLTNSEKKYSQIEKEGLALVFATKKFHRYIFGRNFQLHTDHKPLLSIFGSKKGIPVYTANRLQRWALALLCYDFEIFYTSTDNFGNADILSRLIDESKSNDEDYVIACNRLEEDISGNIDDIFDKLPITRYTVEQFTKSDRVCKKVQQYIQVGRPNKHEIIDSELLQFYNRKDGLSSSNGCIIFQIVLSFLRNYANLF